MNIKKVFIAVLSAANAVSITAGLILTAAGSSLAKSQSYNQAAQRWDSGGGYTQVSCFFTEDAGFTVESAKGVTVDLTAKLKNIGVVSKEGEKLIPEAYSVDAGTMTMRSDTTGRSEAKVTAAGGDFFLFRDFKLLDGAFFTESDIMQDGAVIDRRLAWSLYGSTNVSGMNIYINGTKFYIAGVIEDPETKEEKKTAGDSPRAYISYEGAALLNGGMSPMAADIPNDSGMGGAGGAGELSPMKKINCYECIVPDPVENYAYNSVKEYFDAAYKDKCRVVNNSERFSPSKRAKAYKKLSSYAVADKPIVYPYWENASRMIEFKLSGIYFFRRLTYIIPVLTALLLLVILWRAGGRLRRRVTAKTSDSITKVVYYHGQKKRQKKLQKEEQQEKQKNEQTENDSQT